MVKDDFSERCAEADHVWEEFEQHRFPEVYACKNCLIYARRDGDSMKTIMCAEPGCSSPAEMYMEPESWVWESRHRRRHHPMSLRQRGWWRCGVFA